MEQCRIYIGGAGSRLPFFGEVGRLSIGGL